MSSVYVEEFGREISKDEIFDVLVHEMMMCAVEADWRDYFPYLSWLPNKSFDTIVSTTEFRRDAVMNALIKKQKERIARGEVTQNFYSYPKITFFFCRSSELNCNVLHAGKGILH